MQNVTLAILAGGAGTRMGFPKQLLQLNNRPILEHLLDQFTWPGPTLLITAPGREHPPGADRFDAEAVDTVADQGPLRGVLTALQHSTTDWLVITTVDMPALQREHLEYLLSVTTHQPDLLGAMLQRFVDNQPIIEPFPFACRRQVAGVIKRQFAQGKRSVHSLASLSNFKVEPAPPAWSSNVWTNLNSPHDLRAFNADNK